MPTYEYECTNGHQFEAVQRITAEPLQRCQVCRAKVRRLISASHFILKGGGWYKDGYSAGSNGSVKGSEGSDSSGDKSSSTPSKSESKSTKEKSTKED